jgi:TetR/AcrR family transcriptional regulator of autoinduction and epiphytic fitness
MKEKKRNTSKKRESILNAAAEAFMKDGYDNTSMDRLSELAGASKRTVYNHFPSKEDLFRAVLERFYDEIMELKQITYDPKKALEPQLSDFANAKIDISKNPSWLGLLKVATAVFITNPEIALETIQRTEDAEDTLVQWLEAATDDGRLEVENTKLAAEAFWAMVGGAFFWPSIFFGPMNANQTDELKKELIGIYLAKYRP